MIFLDENLLQPDKINPGETSFKESVVFLVYPLNPLSGNCYYHLVLGMMTEQLCKVTNIKEIYDKK